MSVQAGILSFSPSDACDTREFTAFAQCIPRWHADRTGIGTARGVRMLYQALHVTPEDAADSQPMTTARGDWLTWDGRLDNREDLTRRGHVSKSTPDADVVMAAYLSAGEAIFAEMIGDWSLALYDQARDLVWLASDGVGVRPLYYSVTSSCLLWCTSLTALVEYLGCARDIDYEYVLGLVTFFQPPERTPYRPIRAVPAGTALAFSRDGRVRRVAASEFRQRHVSYRDPHQYVDHFRDLLTSAVSVRLRSSAPVWAHLSGGLDSSAVVSLGAAIQQASSGCATIRPLTHISLKSREADESKFAQTVIQQYHLLPTQLNLDACEGAEDRHYRWLSPRCPQGVTFKEIEIVRAAAGRVILTGRVGDLIAGNTVNHFVDVLELFAQGHPSLALARLCNWSRSAKVPLVEILARHLVGAGSPSIFAWRKLREAASAMPWTTNGLVRRVADRFSLCEPYARRWCEEMEQHYRTVGDRAVPWKRELLGPLSLYVGQRRLETPSEVFDVQYTHPFTHKPLVEFVLAIPSYVLCGPGHPRALMRAALRGIVPNEVLGRVSKGYIAPFELRRWRKRDLNGLRQRVASMALVQAGYVDPDRLSARLQRIQNGSSGPAGNLALLLKAEEWVSTHVAQNVDQLVSNPMREGGEQACTKHRNSRSLVAFQTSCSVAIPSTAATTELAKTPVRSTVWSLDSTRKRC